MAADQTFPKGPAYTRMAYSASLTLFGVSEAGLPGWLLPGDIVAAAVQAALAAGAGGGGGNSGDVAAEAATRAAADAVLTAATGGLVSVPVDTGATVPLSAAQAGNALVVLTGTLTGNVSVTVPAATRRQVVQNNTTGAFTLTYRTPNGTGVVVPQGKSVDTFCDGSSVYVAGSAPASSADTRLPLAFVFPGKPAAGQVANLPLALALAFPAGLAGTFSYAGALPAADMVFTLNRLAAGSGAVTPIGTVTLHPSGHFDVTLAAASLALTAAGDVAQLVAPATQDASGADIGITILTAKV
ncbi:MAG TPA: hypothetical protein VGC15_14305 [Acetobacteraceae bacterium]